MATLPLHLESVLAELSGRDGADRSGRPRHASRARPPERRRPRVVERFYCDDLGIDVTVRSYPGALFVSAGGYHHHIGLNIWNGAGVPASPPGAIGLERFEIVADGEPATLTDPSGIGVSLVTG